MARGFNKVVIMGNLSRDPQVRYTSSKQAVASISVAVNRTWRGRNGETQEQVDFIPVVVWGAQAENCERYLKKGSPVLIEGRLQVRSYEDKSGQRRWVTEVVAQDVNFLPSNRRDDSRPSSRGDYEGSYGGGSNGFSKGPSQAKSFRDDFGGGDDFPMDISEMGPASEADDEADIPF